LELNENLSLFNQPWSVGIEEVLKNGRSQLLVGLGLGLQRVVLELASSMDSVMNKKEH